MLDPMQREINYLRISVTDRCNLRCYYCMPQEGVVRKKHQEILTFEDIFNVAQVAVSEFGFKKIRLTGGEPLLRHGIIDLVKMLSGLDGLEDLCMTTNGILLDKFAVSLKAAGLKRVNVSLDTMDVKHFAMYTGGGDLRQVLVGIDAALAAGLTPVKINCVVKNSFQEEDALAVKDYATTHKLEVRFIKQMDFVSGTFYPVEGGRGGKCSICNRLRLLSDGRVLPCLFSDTTFSIKEMGIRDALLAAITHKPAKGGACLAKWMGEIGG